MPAKKRSGSVKSAFLLETASHGTMGVAVGIAFAFLVTHIGKSDVATLIAQSLDPTAALLRFVGICVITFGIGATVTGLAITVTETRN